MTSDEKLIRSAIKEIRELTPRYVEDELTYTKLALLWTKALESHHQGKKFYELCAENINLAGYLPEHVAILRKTSEKLENESNFINLLSHIYDDLFSKCSMENALLVNQYAFDKQSR